MCNVRTGARFVSSGAAYLGRCPFPKLVTGTDVCLPIMRRCGASATSV